MLSNKVYDVVNCIAKYILPLLSTMLINLNTKLNFADSDLISLIFIQLIAFLNGLLGISSLWYYKEGNKENTDTDTDVDVKRIFPSFPSVNSKYFIKGDRQGTRNGADGYSPCIDGKVQLVEGGTLNNCTALAWGLFAMAENNPDCKIGFIKSPYYPQDAGTWYNNGEKSAWDKYDRGTIPKVGSVICYTQHVAYVNEILDNGDLLVWSSAWGSNNPAGMEEVTIKKSSGYAWRNDLAGVFQGFIYPN